MITEEFIKLYIFFDLELVYEIINEYHRSGCPSKEQLRKDFFSKYIHRPPNNNEFISHIRKYGLDTVFQIIDEWGKSGNPTKEEIQRELDAEKKRARWLENVERARKDDYGL